MPIATAEPVDLSPRASNDSGADRFMRRLLRVENKRKASLGEARNALGTSIFLSGLRCFFTYLVFPLLAPGLGSAGFASGALSVFLGALAVVFSIRSMRRFWAADHRHRWTYTAFAGVVITWVVVDLTLQALGVL